jgi:hypothetical protein
VGPFLACFAVFLCHFLHVGVLDSPDTKRYELTHALKWYVHAVVSAARRWFAGTRVSVKFFCMSACVWHLRDQVRYWRCARTASELRRDMHYQLAPSLRPWTLLAYWTMNEGLGQYVVLLSAHFAFMLVDAPGGVIRCALHAWFMVAALLLDAFVLSLLWYLAGMLLMSRSSIPGASPMAPPGQFPTRRPRPWLHPMPQTPRYTCAMSVFRFAHWSLAVVLVAALLDMFDVRWCDHVCVLDVCVLDAQAQADSGCGHELWPDMTGVFSRKACATLGGTYLRDSKQAMVRVAQYTPCLRVCAREGVGGGPQSAPACTHGCVVGALGRRELGSSLFRTDRSPFHPQHYLPLLAKCNFLPFHDLFHGLDTPSIRECAVFLRTQRVPAATTPFGLHVFVLPLSTSLCVSCQVLRWDKASDGAKAEAVAAFQTLHTEYLASLAKITSAPGTGPTETHDDASTTALVTGDAWDSFFCSITDSHHTLVGLRALPGSSTRCPASVQYTVGLLPTGC